MTGKILRFSLKFKLPISAVILGLTLVSAIYFFSNLKRADNSLPVWFSPNDPAYADYVEFLETFGNDRFVLVALQTPEVFSAEALGRIRDLSSAFEALPEVVQVISLTHLKTVEGGSASLEVKPLLDGVPEDPAALSALKSLVLADPDLSGKIVSRDSKTAILILEVATPHEASGSSRLKERILRALHEQNTPPYPYHLTGSPITDEAFNRLIIRDQLVFFPATVALCLLLLAAFFRDKWMALLPTALQACLLFWILALYFLLGNQLNVVGGLVCPILVTVCIINSVHLMLEYFDGRREGLSGDQAVQSAVSRLARPCLYTALTTIAGFLAFNPSDIPPIRTMGSLTALGVGLALLLTLFFLPILLRALKAPDRKLSARLHSERVQRFLNAAASLSWKNPATVLAVFATLALLSLWGASRLKVETNFFEYFFESEPARRDLEFFDRQLIGAGSFELWLTPADGSAKIALDPAVLREVDRFKQWALRDPSVRAAFTPVDFVKKINQAVHDGDQNRQTVPETPKGISETLLLAFGSEELRFDRFQSPDHLNIRLSFRTLNLGSDEARSLLRRFYEESGRRFAPLGVKTRLTGYGPLWVTLQRKLFNSQVSSLLLSLAVVSALMMIFLKSFKAGLISMIPNALPVLFAFGVMGFFGIRLDVATVMVAAISLGVTVDDTIHYLTRYREHRLSTQSGLEAILKTNRTVGTAIVFSSAVLIGGFGVLCLGSFKPTVYFGLMTAATLAIAAACEIFLMPALLFYLKPFSKRSR